MHNCNGDNLLKAFIGGDENAYAKIYKLYSRDLYAYGLSICTRTELIEDAIHDIFVDFLTQRKKLISIRNLKFYLIAAFRNRLFFLLNKEKVYYDFTEENSQILKENSVMESMIEKETLDEQESLFKQMISKLNPHQREAIYLRFVDGLSIEDIAQLMNINHQSVKNLIHRAISKLRTLYIIITTLIIRLLRL